MKMTPPWLAPALAVLVVCLIPAYAHAYAHVEWSCGEDTDIAVPVDPAGTENYPGSRMSILPAAESYEEGVGYPIPFRGKVVKWAEVFEVPSSWLIPLGDVESKYQPMARNKSGATGVLQIKLARAKDLVTWMNRSKWKTHQKVQEILAMFWHGLRDDLLNLDLNVMLAAFELHHLRRRFGNRRDIVLAAYNQGEGCIARCLKERLPLPDRAIEFIARIERARKLGYA
jgi:soluble lytic murein transglycosylase-like protein